MMNTGTARRTAGATSLAAAAAALLLGITPLVPLDPHPLTTPPTEFSAARAWPDVEILAAHPRPIGSDGHQAARDHITRRLAQVGLHAAIQASDATARGRTTRRVTVQNIVARLPGVQSSGGVLLVAHYDSAPRSPGASDNASGVAALLEVARALRVGPALPNDVIFLFSDGEELGLLGARAFVDQHPLANSVAVVLNFDSRGSRGPAVMIESGGPNGPLVRGFAASAAYPISTSLAEEVYRRMPNTTDFSVFKRAGYAGLNFAFFQGAAHYHGPGDTVANLDPASLQHQGSNALSQTRAFARAALPVRGSASDRSVYFNVGPSVLWRYAESLSVPLAVTAVLLWLYLLTVSLVRRVVTLGGVVAGAAALIGLALGAALVGFGAEQVMLSYTQGRRPEAGAERTYIAAVSGFVVIVTIVFHWWLSRRLRDLDIGIPVLGTWAGLALVTSVMWPGASYLFVWPALVGGSCSAVAVSLRGAAADGTLSASRRLLRMAAVLPALVLITPMIVLVHSAMGPFITVGVAVLVALTVSLYAPALPLLTSARRALASAAEPRPEVLTRA